MGAVRKVAAVAVAAVVMSAGLGIPATAFAESTVAPTVSVPGADGDSCFTVVVAKVTFNDNGSPKSAQAGSVTFNQPVLSCV
jgi:hypothetical protein